MLTIAPAQWLRAILKDGLHAHVWTQPAGSLLRQAEALALRLQKPASPEHARLNSPDQVAGWLESNGCQRMLALTQSRDLFLAEFGANTPVLAKLVSIQNQHDARTLVGVFTLLLSKHSPVFEQRVLDGCIVEGHGDTSVENFIVLEEPDETKTVVAIDSLRFATKSTTAPWNVRDAKWDTAYLSVTASMLINKYAGIGPALRFLRDIEPFEMAAITDKHSEVCAILLYSLYAFYVQVDMLLRDGLSLLQTGNCSAAVNVFADAAATLSLGSGYAQYALEHVK